MLRVRAIYNHHHSLLMSTKDKVDKLIEIFVDVDDFCQSFDQWSAANPNPDFKSLVLRG